MGVGRVYLAGLVALWTAHAVAGEGVPAGIPAEVKVRVTPAGTYMTAADGLALYVDDNDRERPLSSSCNNRCAEVWPPLAAPESAAPVGAWQPIKRADGTTQWAYEGLPVYRYKFDTSADVVMGDGLDRAWHVVFQGIQPPKGIAVHGTVEGRILTDSAGAPLYARNDEGPGKSRCSGDCQFDWRPVPAPWVAQDIGDWSVVTRSDDHTRQWAYRGMPLYARRDDVANVPTSNSDSAKWHVIVLEPTPPMPAWVSLHASDFGPVYMDAKGHTLYRLFTGDLERVKRQTCNQACIAANWMPVLAGPNDKAVGYWAIAKSNDGQSQWTYRGGLVYTFAHDERPGDTAGEKFAGMDSPWAPILQASTIPTP